MHHTHEHTSCASQHPAAYHARERGMRAVMILAALTMSVEIVVGYATGSMALLADGWHMATHVGALALASASYVIARRYANHVAFGFGTAKISTLTGFTSALVLGFAAVAMGIESIRRLLGSAEIDFAGSLPVAIGGLAVNLLSIALLDHHDHEHGGHRDSKHHDHNHRAVVLHVVADALTSALAIVALVAGSLTGATWLDAATGLVGAAVILQWAIALCRTTSIELLDVEPSGTLQIRVRAALECIDDTRVVDLHVWSIGGGRRGCVATVIASDPPEPDAYRARVLAECDIAHLTIEIRRCEGEHGRTRRAA